MGKYKETAIIIRQEEIADNIYSMWLKNDNIASEAVPGQFVSLYCNDGSPVYCRVPYKCICEIDRVDGALQLVYRVAGKGTEEFCGYHSGKLIEVMGPLGNGFPLKSKKAFLIGGGIGIPPMLELAKQLDCEKQIILGYRDRQTFLVNELKKYADVYIATEDGSVGTKGNVLNAIEENNLSADIIYACGPTPMLRALKEYGQKNNIETWISMEGEDGMRNRSMSCLCL